MMQMEKHLNDNYEALYFISDEKKEASRPKRKFLAADVSKMHDILSKNMYKIRQKVKSSPQLPRNF